MDRRASLFIDTHVFELFGFIVARDYAALARKFVDAKGALRPDTTPLTPSEVAALLQRRLRKCAW